MENDGANTTGRGAPPPAGNNNNDFMGWLIVIAALAIFWPVGLILLFGKLGEKDGRKQASRGRHPYDVRQQQHEYWQQQTYQQQSQQQAYQQQSQQQTHQQQSQQQAYQQQASRQQTYQPPRAEKAATDGYAPPQYENQTAPKSGGSKKRKKAADPASSAPDRGWMTILGTCLAAVGGIGLLATLGEAFAAGAVGFLPYLADVFPLMGFVGVGTALIYAGIKNTRKRKRYRKYLALIGKRESVSITALAQTLSVSVKTACNDLQGMLDDGVLRVGYVDLRRDRLVLTADGMADEEPEEPAPSQTKDEDTYLQEIKAVNDDIEDDEMNRKIDRIGEITGKILDYQRNNPNKAGGMRSFLNYYLPTTLKILHAYAQLEAQGIEGENITLAKDRIEGMMDKVVEGFEKQLDKLFQGDALDITSDVAVLEKMLDSDGLSGGDGMTMTL